MATRRRPRAATSLVELLIVVGIIATLIGLTLPAVMKAREAAQRAVCQARLQSLGIAFHAYHARAGRLPPGTENAPGATMSFAAWRLFLLPELDRDAEWRQAVRDYAARPYPFNPEHLLMSRPMIVFECPSDDRVSTPRPAPSLLDRLVAFSSYLGCNGVDRRSRLGVLFGGSGIRWSDVLDGTSHTLLVGERPPSRDFNFGWWYAGVGLGDTGALDAHLGVREPIPFSPRFPCLDANMGFRPRVPQDPCAVLNFWSRHPGGAHFLMCDGSVRFLSHSADPVLPALATRAGNESVEGP
jgi:prepilin-type processing-associated H-X9-DG protein